LSQFLGIPVRLGFRDSIKGEKVGLLIHRVFSIQAAPHTLPLEGSSTVRLSLSLSRASIPEISPNCDYFAAFAYDAFQTCTVLSLLAEAIYLLSGDQATDHVGPA